MLMLGLILALTAPGAQARPELCEDAARRAALETGVPVDVLHAISLTETGRAHQGRMRPWPWAANIDGQGFWFDGPEAAQAFARDQLARGRRSFDLGCFQINWRWHGENLPRRATCWTRCAPPATPPASWRLYDELGNWEAAAGAYHSRTPHLAERYRARFARFRAGLGATQFALSEPAAMGPQRIVEPRVNTFPFLQLTAEAPAGAALASLVPGTSGARPFLSLDGTH
jgi:hypothetical protein